MTEAWNAKTVASAQVPAVIVKHFRSDSEPAAVCQQCAWSQRFASIGEMRIHVRHHPTHVVVRTEATIMRVWAEDRNGVAWEGRTDV